MNRYERGTQSPAVELVECIRAVLNLSVAYFYAINDDEAVLLTAFQRMSEENRKKVLAVALKLDGS